MDLDEETDHGDFQIPSTRASNQPSINKVTSKPTLKKLSVRERFTRLSKYRIRPSTIKCEAKPSGRGGNGEVVRANFKRNKGARGKRVAVKKLHFDEDMDKEFVHEVEMLADLSHENIVKLIGFCEDLDHDKAWIILSWEPNGNVREFLASGEWEIPERISLIQDTFCGLEYLHTRETPIRHGDLKSLNIIVSSSCHAVITDFGSARAVKKQAVPDGNVQDASEPLGMDGHAIGPQVTIVATGNQLTLTSPAWTLRWAAPEVVKDEEQQGLPSDIWSAGWVGWEIMTDRIPFSDVFLLGPLTWRVIQGKVPSAHGDPQLSQITRLCNLMQDCWKLDPRDRPSIKECFNEVKWMPSTPPSSKTSSGSKVPSTELLLQMAHFNYSRDRHQDAALLLDRALHIATNENDHGTRAKVLESLADVYHVQANYTEAEESFIRAQEIYKSIGEEQGRANTLLGLGHVYRLQSHHWKAEQCYIQAQAVYARLGDDQGRANVLDGLGRVYRTQSKYEKAEESYKQAREIYVRIGDDQSRASTLEGLANLYRLQNRYHEAQESYKQTQEIYTRIGDDLGRANTLDGLGDVYDAEAMYTEAEKCYTEAQKIYVRTDHDQGRANTFAGLGNVYLAQSQYTEAEESYRQAHEIYARIGYDHGRADTLGGLGDLYWEQGRSTEAAPFYAQARDLYSQVGDPDSEQHVLRYIR
ncbi:hypothetical protein M407DRAFT_24327 [Tulasnella calospora MUT 4182]|uniref:Protein kinase domain-containing protein n=1 Tax=Tulasnella calospora MUT 4182 TaxID=1051891 RepID=A0A0C3QI29_9AGAM|nr:hypothetical protein M407DRAFT_24327 [Tulasnella calospora MUT 4182]